jgi:hypothetical protein
MPIQLTRHPLLSASLALVLALAVAFYYYRPHDTIADTSSDFSPHMTKPRSMSGTIPSMEASGVTLKENTIIVGTLPVLVGSDWF